MEVGPTTIRKLSTRFVPILLLPCRVATTDNRDGAQTEAVIKQYMNAKVLSKPIGKAACEKFAKKHKKYADTIFSPV